MLKSFNLRYALTFDKGLLHWNTPTFLMCSLFCRLLCPWCSYITQCICCCKARYRGRTAQNYKL